MTDVLPLRSPPADPLTDPIDPAGLPLVVDARRLAKQQRSENFSEQDNLPLVVDARRLAKLLCAGIRTVRTWDAAGRLPKPLRIGGRVVWRVDEIRAWLAAGAPNRDEWEARKAASRK